MPWNGPTDSWRERGEMKVMDCGDRAVFIKKSDFFSSGSARPKLDGVIMVRIAPELRAKLDQVHQHLRMSRSEFARRAMSAAVEAILENQECAEISAPLRRG